MPFNFFKRSKKASIPDPNEAASRGGMRTPSQSFRAQAYGSAGDSSRSGIFGKHSPLVPLELTATSTI